ncbi:MAG: hypothetical protein FWE19_05785 [Oscillospiraceae bacterium]|nr:hypothetical protein [Oscillospiraceae bacterium]
MSKNSAAYNLSTFAPRLEEKKTQLKVVKAQSRAFASAFTLRAAFAFLVVMTLASLMVYHRVNLNELSSEINSLNSQLAILESESVRYSSLLESSVSLRAIAQQAEEMGMVRLDQYRTVHIYLHDGDQVILFGEGQLAREYEHSSFFDALGAIISSTREYIAGN